MHILLINPPYHSLTSLYGVGAQTPLGLLWVGGALIDAGHKVGLLDAEALRLTVSDVVRRAQAFRPDVIMTGHAGSTGAGDTGQNWPQDAIAICDGAAAAMTRARLPGLKNQSRGIMPSRARK